MMPHGLTEPATAGPRRIEGLKQSLAIEVIQILRSLFVLALIIPQGTPVTLSVLMAVGQFGLYMFAGLAISRFSRVAVAVVAE